MKLRMVVFAAGLALGVLWFLGPVLQARTPAPLATPAATTGPLAHAAFAGGCFWCLEASLEKIPGVVGVVSGYAGGQVKKPSYEQVSQGTTGHAESVLVAYDPARLRYDELLSAFWHNVDPTDGGGQFCDRGNQYRTAIFYEDDAQKRAARGIEERARSVEEAAEADRDRDRPPRGLLPRGGLPPGLLQEEPGALHDVPRGLRARPPPRAAVGPGRRARGSGRHGRVGGRRDRRRERLERT